MQVVLDESVRSKTEIQELMRLINYEQYLCWSRRVKNTDVVSDIVWAHSESINILMMFPKTLVVDSVGV